jgi:sporulation protein YlmC with PRC-barrel domain
LKPEESAMRLSDQNLRGRTVIGADGKAVGEISALFVDSESWRVEALQLKLRRDVADQIGAPHSLFQAGALEVPIRLVQSVGDAVVLTVALEGLREVLPSASAPATAH